MPATASGVHGSTHFFEPLASSEDVRFYEGCKVSHSGLWVSEEFYKGATGLRASEFKVQVWGLEPLQFSALRSSDLCLRVGIEAAYGLVSLEQGFRV